MKQKKLYDLNTLDMPPDDSAEMTPKRCFCKDCRGNFVDTEMAAAGFCRWCAMAGKARRFLNGLSDHARVMGVLK